MCCIHGICIFAPGANVSANMIFHPVIFLTTIEELSVKQLFKSKKFYLASFDEK